MSMTSDIPAFGVIATFENDVATIGLRGSIRDGAATELGAVLEAAIDRQPASMVLDVSELEFLGATGLLAIGIAEKRLTAVGTALTIHSPSALVNQLLRMTESDDTGRLGPDLPGHDHLGPEQQGEQAVVSQRFGSNLSAQDLRRVTAIPADPEVIDGALRLIVELARISIAGADGVSVSLLRHGVLSTVAASDQTILDMDTDQYATGEGPCVDASIQGHWFHAESLETETRWPAFTPQALGLGIKSILSSPLRAFERPVGALNIYSRTAESFARRDQESAAVFAQQASVLLSDAGAGVSDTQIAVRFQAALRSREVITLAKGIIMEREGVDQDDAHTSLLRSALAQGQPLRDRAEAVVLAVHPPKLDSEGRIDG